ncbi:MAG TPA: class I SAM-dependent methyltransferase [Chloroflexia bacterium]|nr:class I SAM-dependent methyltransferase [Chloroflexia bacterium]
MSDKPEGINFDTSPPLQVVQYDNTVSKFVPGYEAIFQMALAYLRTIVAASGEVLIVGAGSGKELLTFGQAMPGWLLTGVDPSAHMLAIAREKLVQHNLTERVNLQQGVVEDLGVSRKFQAATCILVMHFLPDNGEKLSLLSAIASRLNPGSPLILVDIYGGPEFVKEFGPAWIKHGHQMGLPLEQMQQLEKSHGTFYPIDEARTLALLEQAGFEQIRRFYSALVYGGWIAQRKAL